MASVKDIAICVRHWDWSETSQTVSILCRAHGLVRAVVKGARREGAPFSGGLELATRGEAVMILKSGDAMATLTSWGLVEAYPAVRRSLGAFHASMYMIDIAQRAVREHDPHPRLFDVLSAALERLATPGEIARSLVWLQWAALADTGVAPALDRDVVTGEVIELAAAMGSAGPGLAFDPARGGLVVGAERGDVWRVRAETVRFLRRVSEQWSPDEVSIWFSDPDLGDDVMARAGKLLASFWHVALGFWPASVRSVYAGIAHSNIGRRAEGGETTGR
ncbi:MAG: DNA repair protein RecO [Phycisphaerales bacterium]|nr:DNA repair protein RecO [Phycisphaerales bacterium]